MFAVWPTVTPDNACSTYSVLGLQMSSVCKRSMPPPTRPFGRWSGVARPPGTSTPPSCFLAPSALLHSTSFTKDASYLPLLQSEGGLISSPTFTYLLWMVNAVLSLTALLMNTLIPSLPLISSLGTGTCIQIPLGIAGLWLVIPLLLLLAIGLFFLLFFPPSLMLLSLDIPLLLTSLIAALVGMALSLCSLGWTTSLPIPAMHPGHLTRPSRRIQNLTILDSCFL